MSLDSPGTRDPDIINKMGTRQASFGPLIFFPRAFFWHLFL